MGKYYSEEELLNNMYTMSVTLLDRDELKSIQPADVAPVVHAHWIKSETEPYKCSACKRSELWMNAVTYEYCPHCGAKMDEEVEPDE